MKSTLVFLKFFLVGIMVGFVFFAVSSNEGFERASYSGDDAAFQFHPPTWQEGVGMSAVAGLVFGLYGLLTAGIARVLARRTPVPSALIVRAFAASGAGLTGCFYLISNAADFLTAPFPYKLLNVIVGLWVMFLGGLLSAGFGAVAGRFLVKEWA